jgi:hypothetical protein
VESDRSPVAAAFRRALLAASAGWPPGALPAALAARLVAGGRWTVARALAEVSRLPRPLDRLRAVDALGGVLGAPAGAAARAGHAAAARAEALSQAGVEQRADALAALAGLVPEAAPEALAAARLLPRRRRVFALARLAHEAPDPGLPALLDDVHAIGSVPDRVRILVRVAGRLPESLRLDALRRALAAARGLTAGGRRGEALARLAAYGGAGVAAEAFTAVRHLRPGAARHGILVILAPHLPPDLRAEALAEARRATIAHRKAALLLALGEPAEALAAARAAPMPADRLGLTAAAALALPDRDALVADLFDELCALDNDYPVEGYALAAALAPVVPYAAPDRVLAGARRLVRESARSALLVPLCPHLPLELAPQLLDDVGRYQHRPVRADVLGALAPRLPDDLLDYAQRCVERHNDAGLRGRALAGLVALLPPPARAPILTAALPPAQEPLAWAGAGLAGFLPPDRQAGVVAAARAEIDREQRAYALAHLVPLVSADEVRQHRDDVDDPDHLDRVLAGTAQYAVEPRAAAVRADPTTAIAALDGASRAECLSIAAVLGPVLHATGGAPAVLEAITAIRAAGP